ncbi:MarR family winged helix-turn-helix transcriptional regulator [uncultured Thomasclavelia sp.]|uniref:MarR family winged helix-turn-helix transcriptional regulator n=1 Tax=uncultured Thomasclavelia sp. TaxID=3025759 RepID=UPI0025E0750D|nr:MarR family transcriptional regulator [uncultured Thomasclavelia sp.]
MQVNIETILNHFTQIRKYYASEVRKRLNDINLSPSEISILILLSSNQSINTSSQLVVLLGISKGLVSRSIDSLQKKGLLECQQDLKDRRVLQLFLTKQASSIIQRLQSEIKKINNEVLGDIPEADIKQMEKTMSEIVRHFKNVVD